MPQGIGNLGGSLFGAPTTDAANVGVQESGAVPGTLGDLDSLLLQIQSGQMSAEAILPLLLLLAMGGMQGAPQAAAAPVVDIPQDQENPIDQAFAAQAGAGPQPQAGPGAVPPDLLQLLGGGGF